jgi:hypothetical protein
MPSLTYARAALLVCTVLAAAGCAVQPVVYERPPQRAELLVVMDAPPALPIYDQPPCPYEGYHWAPGYWAWAGPGYYWVPGTWVMPPRVGVYWTPGYWAFVSGGRYEFHSGYWGERVGYYGGINYGGGYSGNGFVGGRWEGKAYRYNGAVTNVTNVVNVRNVYHETVINNVTVNNTTRVSYSGGQGGARSERTADERNAERMPHLQPTDLQLRHEHDAVANRAPSTPEVNRTRMPTEAIPEAPREVPRPMEQAAHATVPTQPAAAPVSSRPAEAPRAADRDASRREHAKPKPKPKPKPKNDDRDDRDRPQ